MLSHRPGMFPFSSVHPDDEIQDGIEDSEDSTCSAGEHGVLTRVHCLNRLRDRAAGSHTPLRLNGKHTSLTSDLNSCSLNKM